MLDPMLGKLVLRRIGVDSAACREALESGVVKLADLDHKNEAHQEGVQEWISNTPKEKLAAIPAVWLSVIPIRCAVALAPLMLEAKMLVTKGIKNDSVSIEKLTWPEPIFPKSWAEAIAKVLLDKPDWDAFHAVQERLPADIAANLRKELAVQTAALEQQKKEAKQEARKNTPAKVDPLAESIRKRDATRLRKLKLGELSRVRWEAYKDEWLKAPAEILSLAAHVPIEFSRPYEAQILEACAECSWEITPAWPITKGRLQELPIAGQVRFVRDMVRMQLLEGDVPTVEPKLTKAEINNLLLVDALQTNDSERLARFFRGLETVQYLRSIKSNKVSLSDEELTQFRLAAPSEDRSYTSSAEDWLIETEDEDEGVDLILDLLAWVKDRPEHKRPAYAAHIARSDEIKSLFGKMLTGSLFS